MSMPISIVFITFTTHNIEIPLMVQHTCRNLSLGLAIKARAYEGAGKV
jgi:hypothetical protein